MARNSYGGTTHSVTATGSNDSNKQVSVNAWNAEHVKSEAGMLGFTKQSATISGNAIAVTGTLIEIQANETLNTITPTDANEFDLIYLIAKSTATSVTITSDDSGGAGKIRLLSGDGTETLSTTSPMILMCRTISGNKEWIQYGGGVVNAINDIGDVNITSVANEDVLAYDSTTSKWINQSADETGRVTASSTTTFTNKTIDQDATGNSITNLANASIKASAGIDATKIADGSVSSTEFQHLDGVTADIQGQIDAKQASLSFGISSGDVTKAGAGIADDDFIRVNGTTFEGRNAGEVLSDIGVTFGIADTNTVKIDGSGSASGEYAKFTATGIIGEEVADVKTDLSLNNVENTALSTWVGTNQITTLGTITTGTWTGTAIADEYGGTGQATYAQGDILYASATNTLTKLAKGSTGEILTMTATIPEWAAASGSADTPWDVVHNFEGFYYDMKVQTKPANPSADYARFYIKQIDSNNDGLFCIMRKNGSDTIEVQLA